MWHLNKNGTHKTIAEISQTLNKGKVTWPEPVYRLHTCKWSILTLYFAEAWNYCICRKRPRCRGGFFWKNKHLKRNKCQWNLHKLKWAAGIFFFAIFFYNFCILISTEHTFTRNETINCCIVMNSILAKETRRGIRIMKELKYNTSLYDDCSTHSLVVQCDNNT